jgi:hypothetical protein
VSAAPDAGSGATLGGGGRPDERFPRPVLLESRERESTPVSVVATVNLTQKQGKIRFVNPVPGGRVTDTEPESEAALRALDVDGQAIGEYPVRVNLSSELAPDDDREGLVNAVLPLSANTRTLELSIAGHRADTVRVGGPLPSLRGAQRLLRDDDSAYWISLALDRPLEEGHTYAIQVSTDRSKTWRTVGVGLTEPIFTIDHSQVEDEDEVQVRVIATNGLSSLVVTTELPPPKDRSRARRRG